MESNTFVSLRYVRQGTKRPLPCFFHLLVPSYEMCSE